MLPYRRWKYNEEVDEFFVEDDTVVKLKKADVYRETHTTEMDESCLRHVYFENRSIYIHLKIYIYIYQQKYLNLVSFSIHMLRYTPSWSWYTLYIYGLDSTIVNVYFPAACHLRISTRAPPHVVLTLSRMKRRRSLRSLSQNFWGRRYHGEGWMKFSFEGKTSPFNGRFHATRSF